MGDAVMDGGFWDVDLSTPATLDGVARSVPSEPLPLGISRGPRLSRPKQIDFFQHFMSMPFVPSFSHYGDGDVGLSLQRVFSLYRETWYFSSPTRLNVNVGFDVNSAFLNSALPYSELAI